VTASDPTPVPSRDGGETIGVDLGGTKMLVGVVDAAGRTVHRRVAESAGLSAEAVLTLLEEELRIALEVRPQVGAIGLGVPCTIDRDRGLCVSAVNLPLIDVPVRDRIAAGMGRPVSMDNDGNVAAIAESRVGAARGARDVVLLTIGTGIGGGLILDGRPYRGSHGAGAELGHVVVDIDGPPCQGNCPNHGCIESIASGTALRAEAERTAAAEPDSRLGRAAAEGARLDGRLVTELARSGDRASTVVLETIGRRIGVALAGLANIFDPEVIVVGGGVMAAGDLLLDPAREELRERALPPQNEVPVRAAALGPDAGMVGAALLAADELASAEAMV
jgi:glucokinase